MNKFLLSTTLSIILLTSCQESNSTRNEVTQISQVELKASFDKAMRTHLDAVEQKDPEAMQKTMSPNGDLFFMLVGRPLSKTSESFMAFHKEWFKDTTRVWSISFKLLETRVGREMGFAVVETTYEEPDRDGKPYYNKIHTSYTQHLVDDQWYVISDQSSSFKKSTD